MNQATIRSVERSIRFRWASRPSFSCYVLPATATPSAKLLLGPHGIHILNSTNRHASSSSSSSLSRREQSNGHHLRRHFAVDSSLPITNSILFRVHRNYFSSVSAAAATIDASAAATNATATTVISTQNPQKLSALQQKANIIDQLTPGKAIHILQRYAAKGSGNLIRQSDFVELCNSARPGKLRDALVIATALKEFKRNNRFVLKLSGSKAAVEGMLRARMSTWKVQDGKPRVKAALFVAEQILNEDTGLYFAIETVTVDHVLEELHKGLIEMKENGFKVSIDQSAKGAAADDEEGATPLLSTSTDETLINDALRVTQDLIQLLIKRKSRPEWDMKKRAARRYLKRLQIGGGPYRSTLQVATKISLLIGGSAVAQQHVVDPFEKAWWTKFVDEESLKLIEEAREMEEKATLATADVEEDDGDYVSEIDEGDASNADDDEDEVEATDEEDSEAENDKKD